MMKVSRSALVLILITGILFPSIAKAGVVTSKLVEVDESCREELDVQRVKLEECESSKYRLEVRAKELDAKIGALVDKLKGLAADNDDLKDEIDELKNENKRLISERISTLKRQVKEAETVKEVERVVEKEVVRSRSGGCARAHPITSTFGTVIGAPVSTVAGTVRGAVSKGVQVSDAMQDRMGNSMPAQFISKTFGLVIGAVPGAITGLLKGLIDGIRYGICDPFTARSISLEGHFVNDWDSYEIPG